MLGLEACAITTQGIALDMRPAWITEFQASLGYSVRRVLVCVSVVITLAKTHPGRKEFISVCKSLSIIEGSQVRNPEAGT